MAATDPNPNIEPTITGQEAWFNKDVRVYEDLYVYGNLYYNFEGTDSLNLDNLNVSGIATFNDVDITGILDLEDLSLRNIFSCCPAEKEYSRITGFGEYTKFKVD